MHIVESTAVVHGQNCLNTAAGHPLVSKDFFV